METSSGERRSGRGKVLYVASCFAAMTMHAQDLTITNLAQFGQAPFDGMHAFYLPLVESLGVEGVLVCRGAVLHRLFSISRACRCPGLYQRPFVLWRAYGFFAGDEIRAYRQVRIQSACSTDVLADVSGPPDYEPWLACGENRGVLLEWQSITNCPLDCWGIEGDVPPPRITLTLPLADLRLYPTSRSNIDAEAEAEAAESVTPPTTGTFVATAVDDEGTMSMDVSCATADDTQPFVMFSIRPDPSGCINLSWASCSDRIYGVAQCNDLISGVWTNAAWMWGGEQQHFVVRHQRNWGFAALL